MGRPLVHPLALISTALALILVVWLNVNYRVKPFVERTEFSNSRDRVDYQFKQLQYDFYKDKSLGWPLEAYATTLDRSAESEAVPHLKARELKVVGTWNKSGVAIDVLVGLLIIIAVGAGVEVLMRRRVQKTPTA